MYIYIYIYQSLPFAPASLSSWPPVQDVLVESAKLLEVTNVRWMIGDRVLEMFRYQNATGIQSLQSSAVLCSESICTPGYWDDVLLVALRKKYGPSLRPKAAKIGSSTWLNGTMHSWPSNLKAGNGIRNWEPTDFISRFLGFFGNSNVFPTQHMDFGWFWFVSACFGRIQTSLCRWQHPGWLANLRSAGCGSCEKPCSVAPSWQVT